ncbi:hypothetical protein ASG75_00200 [Rhodanobacter sp. Soil772]|uniref:hypothetical protein n=1 Tax=Rhodanobacter sp. Soil772 TaxID=1736406 RepID=UPI000700DF73|nr:hypothetical protein [Rhodanobacter sp. Soil772]KRE86646.1 hypothetical protein ASG75_00200 [Rhodanobacter sp. Soil772]
MNMPRFLPALLVTLLTAPAWAQSADKPLNLKLPPSDLPAPSSTAATPARNAPGVYYGDTSGRMGNNDTTAAATGTDCDDYSYNQPQLHGSVGMGVVSGNHFGGSYQTGTVNLTKAFGSCDHPTGGVSISVGAGSDHFHGRGGH